MIPTAWISYFANLQGSGLVKVLTVPWPDTLPLPVRK